LNSEVPEDATALPGFQTISVCVAAVAPAMPAVEMGVDAENVVLPPAMIIERNPAGIAVLAAPTASKLVRYDPVKGIGAADERKGAHSEGIAISTVALRTVRDRLKKPRNI